MSVWHAGYSVKAVLPNAFMMRRTNKGLENVAVSPDGKTAWTMMQVGGCSRGGTSLGVAGAWHGCDDLACPPQCCTHASLRPPVRPTKL